MSDERFIAENATDKVVLESLALKLFHRLWGYQKDKADYDKDAWVALQLCLNKLGVKV